MLRVEARRRQRVRSSRADEGPGEDTRDRLSCRGRRASGAGWEGVVSPGATFHC